MASSNCCFLTCKQVSQEAGKVVWYFNVFKNFPQFVVIHTVKGFSIVNETEVDVFLEFSCFLCDLTDIGNLISGSSAFSFFLYFFYFYFLIFTLFYFTILYWFCHTLTPLPFLNPAYTSGSSWFKFCWSLAWKILSKTLLAMGSECNCPVFWTFFSSALLGNWNDDDLFQSRGHCWVFQICWCFECSTLTASSFKDFRYLCWNSINSTGFIGSTAS